MGGTDRRLWQRFRMAVTEERLATWFREQLTGPPAQAAWRSVVPRAMQSLWEAPLRSWLSEDAVAELWRARLAPDAAGAWAKTTAAWAFSVLRPVLAAERGPVRAVLDPDAASALSAWLLRDGLIPEDWIHQLFRQRAMEELVADTLLFSIGEFVEAVPKAVQAALPGLLGRFAKFGGSAAAVGNRVLEEVGERLQPEIRRFVERGAGRALKSAGRFAESHIDGPAAKDARQNLLNFGLEKSPADYMDEYAAHLDAAWPVVLEVVRSFWASERGVALAEEVQRVFWAHYGDRSLADIWAEQGGPAAPSFEHWAACAWPVVEAVGRTDAASAWMSDLARELSQFLRAEGVSL